MKGAYVVMHEGLGWAQENSVYLVVLVLLFIILLQTGRINALTDMVTSQERLIKHLKLRHLERRGGADNG